MRWKAVTPLLQVPWNGERGRPLLDNMHLYSQSSHSSGQTWGALDHLVRSLLSRVETMRTHLYYYRGFTYKDTPQSTTFCASLPT